MVSMTLTLLMHQCLILLTIFSRGLLSASLDQRQKLEWFVEIQGRDLPLQDFESGMTSPWADESVADARWLIENFALPFDPNVPAPSPASGSNYLRVNRPAGTSGQAILRSSTFTVNPGDEFTMTFWIRSQILQTNNLEVYWMNGANQERILSLVQFSTPANFEWRSVSVLIPATASVQTRLAIYGFCNTGSVDAVAIDNLVVLASGQTLPPTSTSDPNQSTASTSSANPTPDSTTLSTTQSSGTCPGSFGPNGSQFKCAVLGGKCYCFSTYKVDNWAAGDTYCKSNGATLLNLETQSETSLIDTYITGSSGLDPYAYWSSGQYQGSGFVWTGSNQPFSYTNWYPGQPSASQNGYCVRLFYGADFAGRWSDIICTGEGYLPFYFICEL